VDKLWIKDGDVGFFVGKAFISKGRKRGVGDMVEYIHSFSQLIHSFSRSKLRSEQGFSLFSTCNSSGYYDYLYIYRSGYKTNLSLNWGAL
jgi:hypothetical protein